LILFACCIATDLIAQDWNPYAKSSETARDYWSQAAQFGTYAETFLQQSPPVEKQFWRWSWLVSARAFPSGDLHLLKKHHDYQELDQTTTSEEPLDTLSSWRLVGPSGTPRSLWDSLQRSGIGRVNCMAIHPRDSSILYAGSASGGLWKSTSQGDYWFPVTDKLAQLGVSSIALDPAHPDTLWLATGDANGIGAFGPNLFSAGIICSHDGGESWKSVGFQFDNAFISIRKLAVHPSDAQWQWATTSIGLFQTKNAWNSARLILSGNFRDIEFHPQNDDTLYISSNVLGQSIYRSIDGGNRFSPAAGIGERAGRVELAVSADEPDWVYAVAADAYHSGLEGIYLSHNSGSSYELVHGPSPNLLGRDLSGDESGGQAWYDLAIASAPEDAEKVFVGGINLWASQNAGQSFDCVSYAELNDFGIPYLHVDQHDIQFCIHTGNVFFCNDGGVWKSQADSLDFMPMNEGLAIAQVYRLGSPLAFTNTLYAGLQDNGTQRYRNNEWLEVLKGDGMDCLSHRLDSDIVYASQQFGNLSRSVNGGLSWLNISPLPNLNRGAWITPLANEPNFPNMIFAGYDRVYKSINGGLVWDAISPQLASSVTLSNLSIAIAPSDPNFIYYSIDNQLFRTTTGGSNQGSAWVGISPPELDLSITDIVVKPTDPYELWISLSGYRDSLKILHSSDAGNTWNNVSAGLPNTPANTLVYQAPSFDLLYVGTDVGVFRYDSSQESWLPFGNGLPNVIVTDLELLRETELIRAATYGRGVWESPLAMSLFADFEALQPFPLPGEPVQFRNLSGGEPQAWTWSFEGGNPSSSSLRAPIVRYPQPGTYSVSLTIHRGEKSHETIKTDYISVSSLIQNFDPSILLLYPNPAPGYLIVSSGNFNLLDTKFEVFDAVGRKVFQQEYSLTRMERKILDLGNLANGFYTLRVLFQDQAAHYHFVIER